MGEEGVVWGEADGGGAVGWEKEREGVEKVAGMGRKVWAGEGAGGVSGSRWREDGGCSGESSTGE